MNELMIATSSVIDTHVLRHVPIDLTLRSDITAPIGITYRFINCANCKIGDESLDIARENFRLFTEHLHRCNFLLNLSI